MELKQYKSPKYETKKEAQKKKEIGAITNKIDNNNITIGDLIINYEEFKKDKIKITSYSELS